MLLSCGFYNCLAESQTVKNFGTITSIDRTLTLQLSHAPGSESIILTLQNLCEIPVELYISDRKLPFILSMTDAVTGDFVFPLIVRKNDPPPYNVVRHKFKRVILQKRVEWSFKLADFWTADKLAALPPGKYGLQATLAMTGSESSLPVPMNSNVFNWIIDKK